MLWLLIIPVVGLLPPVVEYLEKRFNIFDDYKESEESTMSDIDVIVRMPEDEYKIIKNFKGPMVWVEHLIKKGTPLPKGHGKIIDESQITEVYYTEEGPTKIGGITVPPVIRIVGTNAPAIIEDDKNVLKNVATKEEWGYWVDNLNGTISCSNCNTWFHKDDRCHYMNYCPNCGKRMANIVGFNKEESE